MDIIENQKKYIYGLTRALSDLDMGKISFFTEKLQSFRGSEKTLFIAGNGGSAATASHAACDFSKTIGAEGKKTIRTICLNDNVSVLTAFGNDTGYENIFSGQIKNLIQKGDMLVVISASGDSENILKALIAAKEMGVETYAFLGFSGGKAKNLADEYLLVPVNDFGIVEDVHMAVFHMVTDSLKSF